LIPSPHKERFFALKSTSNPGASDSKKSWIHAAKRSGMVNTDQGINIDDESRARAARLAPFGTSSDTTASLQSEMNDTFSLVVPQDKELLSDADGKYLYLLLRQYQRVRLAASERVGNRTSLMIGLPGFGCRKCCQAGRLGLSRIFPARRRTLPSKIPDLHSHLQRCTLLDEHVRQQLKKLEEEYRQSQLQSRSLLQVGRSTTSTASYVSAAAATAKKASNEREFFARIWSRLGHGDRSEPAEESST